MSFNTPTKCTYNKIHVLSLFLLRVVVLIVPPSGTTLFVYAQYYCYILIT